MGQLRQKLICGYLIGCLACAGAVSLSPLLHLLIEHGGIGHLHTHRGTITPDEEDDDSDAFLVHKHEHAHQHLHHDHDHDEDDGRSEDHHHETADAEPDTEAAEGQPDHDKHADPAPRGPHHSHQGLPQLVAHGLLLSAAPTEAFLPLTRREIVCPPFGQPVLVKPWFDPQTAGRGPPAN